MRALFVFRNVRLERNAAERMNAAAPVRKTE